MAISAGPSRTPTGRPGRRRARGSACRRRGLGSPIGDMGLSGRLPEEGVADSVSRGAVDHLRVAIGVSSDQEREQHMAGVARGAARAWDRVEGVRLARRAVDHRGIGLRLLHDDHEHGAFDLETIADLAGWFQATNVRDCFNSGGHAAMAISGDESRWPVGTSVRIRNRAYHYIVPDPQSDGMRCRSA